MAAPRMKAPVKKKKTTVKKPKVGTVKSPEETRKSISRKQVGTQRPARGVTPQGAKARALAGVKQPGTSLTVTNKGSLTTPNKRAVAKTGEQVAQNARNAIVKTGKNAVAIAEKWIPNAIKPKGGGMGTMAGGVATAVTSIVSPSFMSAKTGGQAGYGEKEAISRGLGSVVKSNMPGGYGSKTSGYGPTPKKKASGGAPFSKGKGSAALPKTSAGSSFPKGKGTAALPKGKSSSSSTAATSAAASGSSGGSQASKVGVGRQTRYQRNELAMEQRKRSSGTNVSKPKKSIFSLFRKG